VGVERRNDVALPRMSRGRGNFAEQNYL
jgi:hypothetical protein